ncbi:transcription factor bHLH71-like [Rhodamnia argentea]|uniref:Transcription factor bHLH71-like n=1 Tax=Rhodamnia argentea TaxID=178133 RepID=A0A8B8PGU2_9MYRT|nr:transcription factor bHLH71-like [Rhodamnia argentea]
MALDALSANDLLNFIIYDTISAAPYSSHDSSATNFFDHHHHLIQQPHQEQAVAAAAGSCSLQANSNNGSPPSPQPPPQNPRARSGERRAAGLGAAAAAQGRKKRKRRPRVCKNKEEAETQRMTHIAVERNRRKQMNEHLAVLRSLMPESYVQRGDQASIVGGAIEFVKELEHLLQSLEAQKLQLSQYQAGQDITNEEADTTSNTNNDDPSKILQPPFSQFFMYPQYTWSQAPNKYTASSASTARAAIADIEVTLIETHASLRILSRRNHRQLSRLIAGFHTLHLNILHLNVTTLDHLVLYSISAKVEEGCQLTSVDDIAGAVHHMLRIIEEGSEIC